MDRTAAAHSSIVGAFPRISMDLAVERVKRILEDALELRPMLRVCSNAFSLYLKTRPPASAESVRRARDTLDGLGAPLGRRPATRDG